MDVEKVIKGLGCCTKKLCIYKDTEKECPYSELCGDYEEAFEDCTTALSKDALALLKAQEPRVMTWDEVKKKINSGEYVFTECEKEVQCMRYGYAKLAIDQGDSCRIAFLSSGDREDNPHALWWWIYYKNYNKTWRCWTTYPTRAQMEAVKWE